MGISSIYNRFSRWAAKQPAIKLEKTLAEIEGYSRYGYESREDEFAARIKGLHKDGAVISAADLNRVIKAERSKSYWIKPPFKVSQAMLAAGVQPDDDTYTLAGNARAAILRGHLDGEGAVSASMLRYAIICHGDDVSLVNALLARGAKVSSAVLTAAVHPHNLPQAGQLGVVEKIVGAGAKITQDHVITAIECKREQLALYLIDAGAPVSPLQLAHAVASDMRAVAEKLHTKGVSFDEAILECEGKDKDLQDRVKQYRKAITGKAYVDEAAFAALQEQVKTLTERLAKMEAANTDKPKAAATAPKAAAKPN